MLIAALVYEGGGGVGWVWIGACGGPGDRKSVSCSGIYFGLLNCSYSAYRPMN